MSEGTRNYGVPSHRGSSGLERQMIDNHLNCEACPNDDGIKGKWKHFTEFYTDHEKSRGVTNRCKICVKAKNYADKPTPRRPRTQVADPDALNKARFQTSEKLEPAHSLSTFMARAAWTKGLSFEGITL